jgi:SAM-dependent methyltransferase
MQRDRLKWNRKYLEETFSAKPAPLVNRFYRLAPRGRALDIAAGTGRNALFLAESGFRVEAVDISDAALGRLAGRNPRLHLICADLDHFEIPRARYSLILNIRFLNRRLFPQIIDGLVPGGVLLFDTYIEKPGDASDPSMCRDYLLRENELLHAFLALKILYYRETQRRRSKSAGRTASLVGMRGA